MLSYSNQLERLNVHIADPNMAPFLSGQPVSPKKNPGRLNLKAMILVWNALELLSGQASSPERIPLDSNLS